MSHKTQQGFSLIELMVVITIGAIVVAVGAPNLSDYIANNKVNGAATEFQGLIQFARGEAITSNSLVNIHNENGNTDWSNSFSICRVDSASDDCNATDSVILKTQNFSDRNITIKGNAAATPLISFDNRGQLNEGINTITLAFCDSREEGNLQYKLLTISVTGRPSTNELEDAEQC